MKKKRTVEKSKPNQFDPIGHLEQQNLINQQMDNT